MDSQDRVLRYLLLLPGLLVVFLVTFWPIYKSITISFMDWKLSRSNTPTPLWTWEEEWSDVGYLFDNFILSMEDTLSINALYNTGIFTFFAVTISVSLAMFLALLLFKGGVMRSFTRSILLLPFVMSPALVGVSWRFMFNPDYGIMNALFGKVFPSLAGVDWLGDSFLAMFILIATDVWHWTPYLTLLLIGGLTSVPQETIEASKVDGAHAGRTFFDIILPLMLPTIGVAIILKTIFSLKMFDQVYMLTNGGPGNATQTLAHYIYVQGFKYYDMGYASALSYYLVIPLMLLGYVYLRLVFAKSKVAQ